MTGSMTAKLSIGATLLLALLAALGHGALAQGSDVVPFTLSTVGANAAGTLPAAQINSGHGCKGVNTPPELLWRAPPAGTKSFAVTLFDATARKGVGFWHWALFDIPGSVRSLAVNQTPDGAKTGRNDFGEPGFGGACPPAGDPVHTYAFTVWALGDPTLKFDAATPDAEIGAWLTAHALGKTDLTFTYKR